MDVKKGQPVPTIANVIPFPPQAVPSRWATAIATATLEAGCGPEKARSLVAGFKEADALSWDIVSAMASLAGASSVEAYLSSTGCAAIWAASGPS